MAAIATHIDASRQSSLGEFQVEFKLIHARVEATFSAEGDLVVEERGVAIPKVLRLARVRHWYCCVAGDDLLGRRRVLEDAHEAMEGDGKMGDADRLDDGEDYEALDGVAGRVLPMRLGRLDVEVDDIAGARPQARRQPRNNRAMVAVVAIARC